MGQMGRNRTVLWQDEVSEGKIFLDVEILMSKGGGIMSDYHADRVKLLFNTYDSHFKGNKATLQLGNIQGIPMLHYNYLFDKGYILIDGNPPLGMIVRVTAKGIDYVESNPKGDTFDQL